MSSTTVSGGEAVQPFQFKTIKELYDAPEEQTTFCVEGLLPTAGLSVLAGKPKAGKSTLARQLAVSVAQGKPFLDRATLQGAVLYLAIEEKQSEVAAHFKQLGLTEADPVHVRCGALDRGTSMKVLGATLAAMAGVQLVIIDPIFRFVQVKDANDYVKVNDALEQLLEISRNRNVHILTVHHMKKRETDYEIDSVLGSTAITGGVDTYIALATGAKKARTLSTNQRYGRDIESTHLLWDENTRRLSFGATAEEAERMLADETRNRLRDDMLGHISQYPGCTQEAILNAVNGKTIVKKQVLQSLKDSRLVVITGGGVKNDPYTYSLSPQGFGQPS